MIGRDLARLAAGALTGFRLRTALTLLAMAIGVAAVIALTALGEGARQYISRQFSAMGSHLLILLPGRSETIGGPPPVLGETPRDLTLEDALSLERLPPVRRVAPLTIGQATISWGGRSRDILVAGTTSGFLAVRQLELAAGRFLPAENRQNAEPVAVLGPKVREALFGPLPALGNWVRIGDRRFLVTGVLASRGRSFGFDLDDLVLIPVASAQAMFNTPSLFRVLVEVRSRERVGEAEHLIRGQIRRRHEGEDDITIIAQGAMLETFDKIFLALTLTLGGIAAISLGVAGVLIMNVMLVSVTERTAEIGLLKAVGGSPGQILALFLTEAAALSTAGGLIGLASGYLLTWAVGRIYPALPLQPPLWAVLAAVFLSLVTGIVFGITPARRAARLDPVLALGRR